MSEPTFTFACYDYDRVRPLLTGRSQIQGCKLVPVVLPASEAFPRALLRGEFDISELSAGSYIMQRSRGEEKYTAIPAFLARSFRHGAIYIRTDRGIRSAKDLEGKLVGIPSFQFTALMWIRGFLQDEYGVDFRNLRYRTGDLNHPGQVTRPPLHLPSEIDIQPLPGSVSLSDALAGGELDAVISPDIPRAYRDGNTGIRRLFEDYMERERAYWRKTGFFPIMHLVGIRKDVAEKYPWLAANVFLALVQAKAIAIEELEAIAKDSANRLTLPWLGAELETTQQVGGRNYWAYGIERNKNELEAMCRYAHEQYLAPRRLTLNELFEPSTLTLADDFE